MMTRLVLRHEILHSLTKPLLVTVTAVTLVLNILAFQMARQGSADLLGGYRGVLAQFAFLVPLVMILMLGKAGVRCRRWEAGLPLAARPLWWSHLLALILSVLFLTLVTGVSFLGFGILIGAFDDGEAFGIADLLRLVARPLGASLVAGCLIAVWRPHLGLPADASGWARYRYLVMFGSAALLGLLLFLSPGFTLVPVVLAAIMVWRVAATLPAAMEMRGNASGGWAPGSAPEGTFDLTGVGPSRHVVRLTILRTLFKWPLNWLALGPLTLVFGILMSGYGILGEDQPYLRFLNFFMSVYIMFASVNHFMENLHKVDHLPIDRRLLLRWLVVPVAALFVLGYGIGRILDAGSTDRQERILFENGADRYGLKVPAEFFAFSTTSGPKPVAAPWGETHEALAVPVLAGLPGVLWKPYDTPEGASLRYVAWQISRAAAAVYGLEIEPAEIAARYLESDLNGRVTVREPGLNLVADYPGARAAGLGPVLPLLVGAEFVLLLVVLAWYFRVFKPGVTLKKARIVFWLVMAGLMGLHISGYFVLVLNWSQEWLLYGFWLGRMRELGETGPAGYAAAWLGMTLLVGMTWRWAERSFLALEAPSR